MSLKFWEIKKDKGIAKQGRKTDWNQHTFRDRNEKSTKLSLVQISFPSRIKNKYLVKRPTKRKAMTLEHYLR